MAILPDGWEPVMLTGETTWWAVSDDGLLRTHHYVDVSALRRAIERGEFILFEEPTAQQAPGAPEKRRPMSGLGSARKRATAATG